MIARSAHHAVVEFGELLELDRDYLAVHFRPEELGIDVAVVALALHSVSAGARAAFIAQLPTGLATRVDLAPLGKPDPSAIAAAQAALLEAYDWEIVYQRHGGAYALFASHEHFPFDRLYPARRYRGATVLDAGCGSGALARYLAPHAAAVFAVEPSHDLLEHARRAGGAATNIRWLPGAFESVPLPDASVDHVVSNMAFQGNPGRGAEAGLRELRRVLRAGGEIRMVVGSRETQQFMGAHGFRAGFVPGRLRWSAVEGDLDDERLARRLQQVAYDDHPASTATHDLFGAQTPRLRWWAQSAAVALKCGTLRGWFARSPRLHPVGIPIYFRRFR